MFKIIVTVASHLPMIGPEVRDLVRMTARLQELGADGYELPEGDVNFLELMGMTR